QHKEPGWSARDIRERPPRISLRSMRATSYKPKVLGSASNPAEVGRAEAVVVLQSVAEQAIGADMREPDERDGDAAGRRRKLADQRQRDRTNGRVGGVVGERAHAGAGQIAEKAHVGREHERGEQP